MLPNVIVMNKYWKQYRIFDLYILVDSSLKIDTIRMEQSFTQSKVGILNTVPILRQSNAITILYHLVSQLRTIVIISVEQS